MNITGYNANDYIASKWLNLKEIYISRIEEHGYLYYDVNIALVLGACGTEEEKDKYFKSLTSFLSSEDIDEDNLNEETFGILKQNKKSHQVKNFLKNTNREFATELLNALCCFGQGEFDHVVESLYPIRYDVFKIGGSNAQRDLLNQILIFSALQSHKAEYKKIAYAVLHERQALVSSNFMKQMTDRLLND